MRKRQPRRVRIRRATRRRVVVGFRLADDVRALLPRIAAFEDATMTAVLDSLVRERARDLGIA